MEEKVLKDAAARTPDPERSLKNLLSFLSQNPSDAGKLRVNAEDIGLLFSYSQFLANYCIAKPDILFHSLRSLESPFDKEAISSSLSQKLKEGEQSPRGSSIDSQMTTVREFKTREILRITLRDILKKADVVDTMLELSGLADIILEKSLLVVKKSLNETYGAPSEEAFSVISLGKLGGEELNFSSDVDLMYVYGTEEGETSGVRTLQGVSLNRISNHEYYCKMGEALTRFLSLNTSSGFGYRVDLRLRPEGQRGAIALALRGYEIYYESWGRAWERAMLIRARPAAGDIILGNEFLEMVRPFVYRKYLDFSSIDEIRRLKTRIDSMFKRSDIKRGYGGIREVEFFAQALQLIYGGKEPLLRERSVLKALHRLLQKALIGQEDYLALSENYRYFRTIEHRLQQLNDLQTYTIPTSGAELEILGRKVGIQNGSAFFADLEGRREKVRRIYDSLFSAKEEQKPHPHTFLDEELSDSELREFLAGAGLEETDKAVRNIKSIKESTTVFQTLRGRKLLGEILPEFIDSAIKSPSPGQALNRLQSFTNILSANESYLEIFSRNSGLIDMLSYVFSQSEYLSKILMSRPGYLEMLGWQEMKKKSRASIRAEIEADVSEGRAINDVIRVVKQGEEIRLGLLFLQKKIGIPGITKGLSRTAEAILATCMGQLAESGNIALIGFGKLGGREITFNSDLDLIFVSSGDLKGEEIKSAERVLRMLISYTKEGIAYRVDTRLRPDGSKGPLLSPIGSFRKYYAAAAAFWEFQALLKARPVAGDIKTGLEFMAMAKETLMKRGKEIRAADILRMRERIIKELSKESEGYDIKLGPGGMEEAEFAIQYLQLMHASENERVLVQGTIDAVKRLAQAGYLEEGEAGFIAETYTCYRTLETFLRLRGEQVLKREEKSTKPASEFMGYRSSEEFIKELEKRRKRVREFFEKRLISASDKSP